MNYKNFDLGEDRLNEYGVSLKEPFIQHDDGFYASFAVEMKQPSKFLVDIGLFKTEDYAKDYLANKDDLHTVNIELYIFQNGNIKMNVESNLPYKEFRVVGTGRKALQNIIKNCLIDNNVKCSENNKGNLVF